MSAGAGGDPAAERRELVALRKVPQRQPVRLELGLQRRPEGATLDARRAGGAVDLDDAMHVAKIHGHRGLVAAEAVDTRFDAADHAGTAAEGCDRGLRRGRPVEHGGDVALVARINHGVGGGGIIAEQPAHVIRIGFSVGVRGPVIELARGDRGERCRRLHPRRMQLDFVQPRRLDLGEFVAREPLLDPRPHERFLLGRDALAFASPAEMF